MQRPSLLEGGVQNKGGKSQEREVSKLRENTAAKNEKLSPLDCDIAQYMRYCPNAFGSFLAIAAEVLMLFIMIMMMMGVMTMMMVMMMMEIGDDLSIV